MPLSHQEFNLLITQEESQQSYQFWMNQFSGIHEVLEFRQLGLIAKNSVEGHRSYQVSIPEELQNRLSQLTDSKVGKFTILSAVLNLLLSKYTGKNQVFIKTPLYKDQVDRTVESYVEEVLLVYDFAQVKTLRDLVLAYREIITKSYENQRFPVDIQMDHERKLNFYKITNVFLYCPSIHLYNEEIDTYDLSIAFEIATDQIGLNIRYNQEVFSPLFVENFCTHFTNLLAYLNDIEMQLTSMHMLGKADRSTLLSDFGTGPTREIPSDHTLLQYFEKTVEEQGKNIAIIGKTKPLTYEELDNQSTALASHWIDSYHLQKGDRVGLCLPTSSSFILAVLSVVKAGAVFVPVDPSEGPKRRGFIFNNAAVKFVVADPTTIDKVNEEHATFELTDKTVINPLKSDKLPVLDSHDIAYIMHTSGTEGLAKGVEVTHGNMVNYLLWAVEYYFQDTLPNMPLFTSPAFDLTLTSMFAPLMAGGKIFAFSNLETDLALDEIFRGSKHITAVKMTPSHIEMLQQMDEDFETSVEFVIAGGEELKEHHIQFLKSINPEIRIYNEYGPTEATVGNTITEVSGAEVVSIGKPINNTRILIIDQYQDVLPAGGIGEIYIGGKGITKGYLNHDVLTKKKYVSDDYSGEGLLYKTGDLGCFLENGEVFLIGRRDDQVKWHGHRIETGEIEYAIKRYPGIRRCVVQKRKDQQGEDALVAYYVSAEFIDIQGLKKHLGHYLDRAVFPSHYVPLKKMPLTLNGKIDRNALPDFSENAVAEIAHDPPATFSEKKMAAIWEEVLRRKILNRDDDFFDMGGHSLKSMRIIASVKKQFGVQLNFSDFFKNSTVREITRLVEEKGGKGYEPIHKIEDAEHYEISYAQRRFWVVEQIAGKGNVYNMPYAFKVKGELELSYLQQSIYFLIERHETLRTVFLEVDNKLIQKVLPAEALEFHTSFEDCRLNKNAETYIKHEVEKLATSPFNLSEFPLFRFAVWQITGDELMMAVVMHHVIGDGESVQIFFDELSQAYDAFSNSKSPDLAELSIQYRDYANWHHQLVEVDDTQSKYWLDRFSDDVPVLDLPLDFIRPNIKTFNGKNERLLFDTDISYELKELAIRNQVSLYTILLTTVHVLLHRYTSETDMVIGTPITGRDHPDLDAQIGLYMNMLPLRTQFSSEDTFLDLLSNVKETTLKAFDHQLYPFDKLVDDLSLKQDLSRSPIFDVVMSLLNDQDPSTDAAVEGINFDAIKIDTTVSKYDLLFYFTENTEHIGLSLTYNTDLFKTETITRMLDHFQQLVVSILKDPMKSIGSLKLLDEQQERRLIDFGKKDNKPGQYDLDIPSLFTQSANKHKDKVAVFSGGVSKTYEELDHDSDLLATHILQEYGVQKDKPIALIFRRSYEMIVSIMAVLKSGNAYVALDPNNPVVRNQFILDDSQAGYLLMSESLLKQELKEGLEICVVSEKLPELRQLPAVDFEHQVGPSDLAYIAYTSGSTGQPKGIMVEHRGVVRLVQNPNYITISPNDKLLQLSSYVFDGSVFDIFGSLLNGASLYLVEEDMLSDRKALVSYIKEHQINITFITTALLNVLADITPDFIAGFDKVLFGGEKVSVSHVAKLLPYCKSPEVLVHMYGPTENTTFSTYYEVGDLDPNAITIPIGKPVSGSGVHVLDNHLNLVPQGVIGEICVYGEGLARGYLNNRQLTKEQFIKDPVIPGEHIYRTGDLGRFLPDGNLEFIGRKDDQIKIRGFRVELGEIEHRLREHTDIREVSVQLYAHDNDEKGLVAYYTSEENLTIEEIRIHLSDRLPSYMIPERYICLADMPLNANGKIDKKALPDPEGSGLTSRTTYTAPRDEMEKQLVSIWEGVLHQEKIGIHDDFFLLGGHSLKALQLRNEYQKVLSVNISLKELFAHTSISSHADIIKKSNKETLIHIEKVGIQPNYPISDSQRRLWVLSQFEEGSVAYNMPGNLRLNGDYSLSLVQKSFDSVIERHEILRTLFKEDENGEIRQWVISREALGFKIDYLDYRRASDKEQLVKAYISEDAYKAFDLENGPLIRISLIHLEEQEFVLYFNMHHIISDGWSLHVLSNDFQSYYEAYKSNRNPELKPLLIQYKDYSSWQLSQLKQKHYESHRSYWLDRFSGELPSLDLPTSKLRPRIKTQHGKGLSSYLDKSTTTGLKTYIQENSGSLFMALLAGWKVLMYKYTSSTDMIIGTPVSGREHADLEDQIGFYVNTLAIRNELNPEESFNSFYHSLRAHTLEAYDHQMYPFDRLVEELSLRRDTGRSAIFDVMFSVSVHEGESEEEDFSQEDLDQVTDRGYYKSKFDLEVFFQDSKDFIGILVVFNSDVYEKEMVSGLVTDFKNLLSAILKDPTKTIGNLKLLDEQQESRLIDFGKKDNKPGQYDLDIPSLFTQSANKYKDKVAVFSGGVSKSYAELDHDSDLLATFIVQEYGVQKDKPIALIFRRSYEMIVSILAVLKSGNAYVALDPNNPVVRNQFILEDSKAGYLLVSTGLLTKELGADLQSCVVSEKLPELGQLPVVDFKHQVSASDLAYIIYTSGSTGQPKGIMIEHRGVIRMVKDPNYITISPDDKLLQLSSYVFDASVFDVFGSLLNGASLYLVEEDMLSDREALVGYMKAHHINITFITTALLNVLADIAPDFISGFDKVLFGGEKVSVSHVAKLLPFCKRSEVLVHMYGPAENTTFSTYYKIGELESNALTVPIGKPVSGSGVHVLDDHLNLVPQGVVGEICVYGEGLARGYLNNPQLTNAQFILDPLIPGEHMYRTGDLGRMLPDGNIEFIGRRDDQIKIRGFRVELGEVEHHLREHEGIRDVSVMLHSDDNGDKGLIAYYTSVDALTGEALRAYLKNSIPSYMIPKHYIHLEEMPLNANGKIDKKALPPLLASKAEGFKNDNLLGKKERQIAQIWSNVLGIRDIGLQDDFFELGGHSLTVMRLIHKYQKTFGVKIVFRDFYMNRTIGAHKDLISQSTKTVFSQIEKVAKADYYPISDGQRRLWVLSQFDQGSLAYHMPLQVDLDDVSDVHSLILAIHHVVDKHEILRTVFKEDESGVVFQQVLSRESLRFKVNHQVLSEKDNPQNYIHEFIRADGRKSFDLKNGPLIRMNLFEQPHGSLTFYMNAHHIICDGWSLELLFKEITASYRSLNLGQKIQESDLRIQYKDYASWQIQQLSGDIFQRQKVFWTNMLTGELPLLSLPGSHQRPKIQTYNGQRLGMYLSAAVSQKLKAFTQEREGSLFVTLLASWKAIIHRYTSQNDIIIGTSVAGRGHADLEDQVGFYVNTLPIRNSVHSQDSFLEFYDRVKEITLEAFENQMYPFDRLVDELKLPRDTSRSAVFDVMLTLQNTTSPISADNVRGVHQEGGIVDHGETSARFDIDIDCYEAGDQLYFSLVYNTDIYQRSLIDQLMRHYAKFVSQVLETPGDSIGEINFLSGEERDELLNVFNDYISPFPQELTLVDLLETQVDKNPEGVAVVFHDIELTFRQFDELTNQLSAYLKQTHALQKGDQVAIKLERSHWLIVSVFGVLKAGAAYVPIDITYPKERIQYIEQSVEAKVCLDSQELQRFERERALFSTERVSSGISPQALAYVIFTSGSTGNPKGVLVDHAAVVNICLGWEEAYQLDSFQVNLLQLASFSFDVFVADFCRSFLVGGTLIMCSDEDKFNLDQLAELMVKHEVSILEATPTMARVLVNHAHQRLSDANLLKVLITSGEEVTYQDFRSYAEKLGDQAQLINSYGITETAIDTTYYKYDRTKAAKSGPIVPIGVPFANNEIYILNETRHLQPKEVIGEIYIGGKGLAQGYLNNKTLTEERFVPSPFEAGKLLYKTGDLAKWSADGIVEFIGRNDNQVKVRGYRIELGEIEAHLQAKENIKSAVVLTSTNSNAEDKILVAFVNFHNEPEVSDLKSYLADRIPDYMIPNRFIPIDQIPLTGNGKMDRKALLALDVNYGETRNGFVGPRNTTEKQLAGFWAEILDVEKVDIYDNFFELGGQSLKAMRLITAIHKYFDVQVKLKDIFLHPTIASLADIVENAKKVSYRGIEPVPFADHYELSHAQKRLWLVHRIETGLDQYNMPGAYRIKGSLNVASLQKALQALVERHEILRTVIHEYQGEARQKIIDIESFAFELQTVDVSGIDTNRKGLEHMMEKEVAHVFNLSEGPLLQAILYHLHDDEHIFFINFHHIIFDGWSFDIFMGEFSHYYDAFSTGTSPQLPELKIQYKDYAHWHNNLLEGDLLKRLESYWGHTFADLPEPLELLKDYERPLVPTYEARQFDLELSLDWLHEMKTYNETLGTSMFMTTLAVYYSLLYKYAHKTDIIIGTPSAGRDHPDLYEQIGFYINMLPIRMQFDPGDTFEALLLKVKDTCLEVFDHQQYPFDRMVEKLKVKREIGRSNVYDVGITWVVNENVTSVKVIDKADDLEIEPYNTGFNTIKGDLWLYGTELDQSLHLSLQYSIELFSGDRIELMKEKLLLFLQEVPANVHMSIDEIWNEVELQIAMPETDDLSLEINL